MLHYIARAYKNGKLQGYMSTSWYGLCRREYITDFKVSAYSAESIMTIAERAIKSNNVEFDTIKLTQV